MNTLREKILEQYESDLPVKINGFFKYHRPLSNFHIEGFDWKGITWPSSENAFQAAKFIQNETIFKSFSSMTPSESKNEGRKLKLLTEDWDITKFQFMHEILIQKFNQCPIAKEVLLSTGEMELIENNWWKDSIWGTYDGYGQNNLGKILMKVRALIRLK